jgi:hypothetical protein
VADGTAPTAAVAAFRGKIFESAYKQAAEERSWEIRENPREKQKQRKL